MGFLCCLFLVRSSIDLSLALLLVQMCVAGRSRSPRSGRHLAGTCGVLARTPHSAPLPPLTAPRCRAKSLLDGSKVPSKAPQDFASPWRGEAWRGVAGNFSKCCGGSGGDMEKRSTRFFARFSVTLPCCSLFLLVYVGRQSQIERSRLPESSLKSLT